MNSREKGFLYEGLIELAEKFIELSDLVGSLASCLDVEENSEDEEVSEDE